MPEYTYPGRYAKKTYLEIRPLLRANPDRSTAISLLVARPPGWSSDARSELRQQLASTFGRFTVDHLGVGPIIPRPMARRRQRPS